MLFPLLMLHLWDSITKVGRSVALLARLRRPRKLVIEHHSPGVRPPSPHLKVVEIAGATSTTTEENVFIVDHDAQYLSNLELKRSLYHHPALIQALVMPVPGIVGCGVSPPNLYAVGAKNFVQINPCQCQAFDRHT